MSATVQLWTVETKPRHRVICLILLQQKDATIYVPAEMSQLSELGLDVFQELKARLVTDFSVPCSSSNGTQSRISALLQVCSMMMVTA